MCVLRRILPLLTPFELQTLPITHKDRVRTSHPLADYNLVNLVAYTLYPPLYIAGPIMTFNDFIWQVSTSFQLSWIAKREADSVKQIRRPIPPTTKNLLSYAVRFLTCLLTMEVVLHFMYVVAIKDTGSWDGNSPAELSMIGFWNLIVVWLKVRWIHEGNPSACILIAYAYC